MSKDMLVIGTMLLDGNFKVSLDEDGNFSIEPGSKVEISALTKFIIDPGEQEPSPEVKEALKAAVECALLRGVLPTYEKKLNETVDGQGMTEVEGGAGGLRN